MAGAPEWRGIPGGPQITRAGRERSLAERTCLRRPVRIQGGVAGGKRPFRSRLHAKNAHIRLGTLRRGNRPRDRRWDRATTRTGRISSTIVAAGGGGERSLSHEMKAAVNTRIVATGTEPHYRRKKMDIQG